MAILENYSRAMLASAVTLTQNTNAYLSVLHAAIERHGSPKKIVTDGGGIFRSDRAKAVYRALNIEKEEIERGQAWQSFIETNFNVQRRMADFYFARAESWEELVAEHDLWLERHNTQRHQAHEGREDGRRSPSEVLGPVRVVRYHPVDLERAFFSRAGSPGSWTLSGTLVSGIGGCMPRKGSPANRWLSGSATTD